MLTAPDAVANTLVECAGIGRQRPHVCLRRGAPPANSLVEGLGKGEVSSETLATEQAVAAKPSWVLPVVFSVTTGTFTHLVLRQEPTSQMA